MCILCSLQVSEPQDEFNSQTMVLRVFRQLTQFPDVPTNEPVNTIQEHELESAENAQQEAGGIMEPTAAEVHKCRRSKFNPRKLLRLKAIREPGKTKTDAESTNTVEAAAGGIEGDVPQKPQGERVGTRIQNLLDKLATTHAKISNTDTSPKVKLVQVLQHCKSIKKIFKSNESNRNNKVRAQLCADCRSFHINLLSSTHNQEPCKYDRKLRVNDTLKALWQSACHAASIKNSYWNNV